MDRFDLVEGGSQMSSLMGTVKHVRYVMGSLTAVLFAVGVGDQF